MKHVSLLLLLIVSVSFLHAQDLKQLESLLSEAKYQEAIQESEKALSKNPPAETAIALKNITAEALVRLGKFDEASRILDNAQEQAATANLTFQQGITRSNYGLLYMIQGRNDRALESLEDALTIFDKSGKSETLEAAQALSHLGNLYRATGKFSQAEEQLNRALAIRQKFLKDDTELMAAAYNDLGLVFSMTDPDKALDFYEKALAIYKKLHDKDHPKIATATTNVGFIYRTLELYGDAVNNFEASLKIWEKMYPQAHPSKAFVLFNLGVTYNQMGDAKAARGYYERALKMYEESYGRKHPETGRVLNAIGDLDLAANKFDDALATYQRSLHANVADFNSSDPKQSPHLKNYYDGNVLLNTMLSKAQALEARHYGKTLKFEDLTLAIQTLQRCDTLIDKLRQQINNESDKISLGAIATEVYANGVRISYEASQVAFKKKSYYEHAFYFAEKSKSAVLLEAISDANAKSFAGIPQNLLEEEKTLKSAIALCAQGLAQKPSADEEKYLREASFNLNRQYEAFVKKMEKEFPSYYNLKFNAAAPSIPQLQAKLDQKTMLVSYFTDEKNNRIYSFQITEKTFRIEDHAITKDFDRYITGLRNSIFFNEKKSFTKAVNNLSEILIPDRIAKNISDLIILPVGRLGIIPFEALVTDAITPDTPYPSMPFLIRKYNVRYEFSAGLILQKEVAQTSAQPSIFLCAPVTFPAKDNLNDLPGTESEVNDIASLFNQKQYKSSLLTRNNADEKKVKSPDLKSFDYIHFATHGIVDESNPELSRIFLQSDVGSEDGNLFAGEIYNLNLNARLVTLSACQTGLGKISKGEGVIGLSRALVYAGAKSLIVSFWSVADESTAVLMKNFYQEMLQHPQANFSENLKQAKLSLVKDEKYTAPYYWAPFILIGF
ncbi:CHAT domain-containing protein [Pseudochryseolinea flava]|uniref:CHAT domain-containing protein n=1 Tax=Pseudochryseolinea flava TaxID=2059302 RepID=A0A364Y3I6_9BACT|nr:CHAT domain-containing protein [Pseudochryseolinea flava]RAW01370.1 hypothetical protein DQQ10_10735 [Pseudochryseolinea flava]